MGGWPTVVINGRAAIHEALIQKSEIYSSRPGFFSMKSSKGICLAKYSHDYRMFANVKKNPMEDIIHTEVDYLIQSFVQNKGRSFNPYDFLFTASGSVIYQVIYGKHEDVRENQEFINFFLNAKKFTDFVQAANPIDPIPWLRFLMPTKLIRFAQIIQSSRKTHIKKIQEHIDTFNGSDLRDVTDRLLQLNKDGVLDDELVLPTIADIFGAGFNTVASTIEWFIMFMASHPEAQQKVQREIDEVVGFTRKPCLKDKSLMPYTEAVLHETMRLSCIVPLAVPHYTTTDSTLAGYHIPKGTVAIINLFSMSMDEKIWKDPEQFRPERFLDDSGQLKKDLLEEFHPFSNGRRKCL